MAKKKGATSAVKAPKVALHRIRQLREEAGLSQQALADRIRFDKTKMSRVEKGTTDLDVPMMREIAAGLGRKASALLLPEDIDNLQDGPDGDLLAIAHQLPVEGRALLITCARELVGLVGRMLAQGQSTIMGDPNLIGEFVAFWNQLDDSDRSNVLTMVGSAGFADRGLKHRSR